MGSWLRIKPVSQSARSTATEIARPAIASLLDYAPVPAPAPRRATPVLGGQMIEGLEQRTFLSGSPFDLTNTYGGSITFKIDRKKVKEPVSVVIVSQADNGIVKGQFSSEHAHTVDFEGMISGKKLLLIGTSEGAKVEAKIGRRAKNLSGKLFNGSDGLVGKLKIKITGDAPQSVSPASGNVNPTGGTGGGTTTTPPTTDTGSGTGTNVTDPTGDGGPLDPSIDPATGLPKDSNGNPIDIDATPNEPPETPTPPTGEGGSTAASLASAVPLSVPATKSGGGITTMAAPPSVPAPLPSSIPGTLIGANYSFTGNWADVAGFNFDSSGGITDAGAGVPGNGTVEGTDPRAVTISTTSQDVTGLVVGTIDIGNFGTFSFTGMVAVTSIDLILTGTSPGADAGVVHLDLTPAPTYDAAVGTIQADANGYHADGPLQVVWQDDDTTPPPTPVPLPTGAELYHVDDVNNVGDDTTGNFDPNGATLGEDFAVGNTPIIINSLGAFDSGADGLSGTIRVAIYNTSAPTVQVAVADINTANSELAGSSSFRYLTTFTPVTLTTGVYRIVAFGFDAVDLAGDVGVSNYTGPVPTAYTGTTGTEVQYPLSNGINANNWASDPATNIVYPTNAQGLPLNRYLGPSALVVEGTPTNPGGGGGTPIPPTTPPVLVKPANSAYPGGIYTTATGPEVFGSQSAGIIP